MNIEENEVTFQGRFPLSGTFAYPGEGMEPLPTVLFFPGSGQVDRDENANRQIVCPTLAITGSKDFQVKPADVYKMKELIPGDTEVHIVENLTHILRKDMNQTNAIKLLRGNKQSVKLPLDAGVVDLIQAWAEAWKRRVPS